eukprot:scaffold49296_cov27-Phaeocystis_antarctica.AAC.1
MDAPRGTSEMPTTISRHLRADGGVDLLELVALPHVVQDGAHVDVAQQREVTLLLIGVGRRRLQCELVRVRVRVRIGVRFRVRVRSRSSGDPYQLLLCLRELERDAWVQQSGK